MGSCFLAGFYYRGEFHHRDTEAQRGEGRGREEGIIKTGRGLCCSVLLGLFSLCGSVSPW